MAKISIGIKKMNERIYRVQRVFECGDPDLKTKLNACVQSLFISDRSNTLPPEFSRMSAGRDNTVYVELSESNIFKSKNGYAIRGLKADAFTFLARGKEGGELTFDSNLSDQYYKLHTLLTGRYDGLEGIDFDRLSDDHNAEDMYALNRLNLYIEQKRYGYGAVYYKMFKNLFDELDIEDDEHINLHVVSVGTGSKTDAIALKYAIEDYPGKFRKCKFTGIDVKAWSENKFFAYLNPDDEFIPLPDYDPEQEDVEAGEFFINNEIEIFGNRITESIREFEDSTGDGRNVYLVVFPNMISEVKPAELLGNLLDEILNVYEEKETYILTSENPSIIDEDQLVVMNEKCGDPMISFNTSGEKSESYIWDLGDYYGKTGEGAANTLLDICRELSDNCDIKKPIIKQKFIRYRVFSV